MTDRDYEHDPYEKALAALTAELVAALFADLPADDLYRHADEADLALHVTSAVPELGAVPGVLHVPTGRLYMRDPLGDGVLCDHTGEHVLVSYRDGAEVGRVHSRIRGGD